MATSAEQFPSEEPIYPGHPLHEELKRRVAELDKDLGFEKTRAEEFTKPPQENYPAAKELTEKEIEAKAEERKPVAFNLDQVHQAIRELAVENIDRTLRRVGLTPEEIERMLNNTKLTDEEKGDMKRYLKAREEAMRMYHGNQEASQ